MNFSMILADAAQATGEGGFNWKSILLIVGYVVIFGALMYFIAIRPQKKQQKQQAALLEAMEVGDSVVTSGGFYGVIIDISDDTVIVEFGNNKNCRIPMQKAAIVNVEKADQGQAPAQN